MLKYSINYRIIEKEKERANLFKINDTVIYGTEGICTVSDITEKNFGGTVGKYYILKPKYSPSSTIMIPMDNPQLVSKMRYMLSGDEVRALIDSMPQEKGVSWIDDEKKRKEKYRALILRGERRELVGLIKTLYLHSEKQKALGKKLHASDERFFRDAEKLLYEEFACALGIEKEQVISYILSKLAPENKAE